jgi:nitroreductase
MMGGRRDPGWIVVAASASCARHSGKLQVSMRDPRPVCAGSWLSPLMRTASSSAKAEGYAGASGVNFHEVVRKRRSVRAFLPSEVPNDLLRRVLEEAALTPSNCNTQPWDVHIISGLAKARLSKALVSALEVDRRSPDFRFDRDDYHGVYAERSEMQGRTYYDAVGIGRLDREDRRAAARRNYEFFGAPHVGLLFMPVIGDCVRTAGDIGMYGQTFLLSLVANGLAGIAQTALGFFADTIRDELGIDPAFKLLFGISFGYADEHAPSSAYSSERAAIDEHVTFHR